MAIISFFVLYANVSTYILSPQKKTILSYTNMHFLQKKKII